MLVTITHEARQWALNEWEVMQERLRRPLGHRELAGFIGEAVLLETLQERLFDADHGPLFGNDLIVEGKRVEVKTQTSPFQWKPSFWAWAPGWKPDEQDYLFFNFMWIAEHSVDGVLQCDQIRIRGWYPETMTHRWPVLARGSDTPLKDNNTLHCDVLQIPDAELFTVEEFNP